MPEERTERVLTESNPDHFESGISGKTNAPESHQSDHKENPEGHSIRKKQDGEHCTKSRGQLSAEINGFLVERQEKQGFPGRIPV